MDNIGHLTQRLKQEARGMSDTVLTQTSDVRTVSAATLQAAPPSVEQAEALAQITSAAAVVRAEEQRRGPRGTTPSHVARMAAARGRATPLPGTRQRRGSAVVTASASAGPIVAGSRLASSEEVGEVMAAVLNALPRNAPPSGVNGRHMVASANWKESYPEERRLAPQDPYGTSRKLEAVVGPRSPRYGRDGALVASGGICSPVNVDYAVPTWATAARPFRDSLPAFQADRGGLQFVTPPDIGIPSLQGTPSGLGSATDIWTEATDSNPAGAIKPVYQVVCGEVVTTYINAVPTRLGFGNMQGRFAPEQLAANTDVAMSVAAREAELELLTLMANSTVQIKAAEYLGAVRDLLATADILVHQYRSSHRFPEDIALTAVFPAWARGVMRSDLAREVAHDNAGAMNVLAITDEQIDAWWAVRGVNVVWTLDGLKAGEYGTGGSAIPAQFFPTVTAQEIAASGATSPLWPGQSSHTAAFVLAWFLFVEGTFQFLDGGRLDLGVIRDSTLDATNDYETFVEPFEGLAFRGLEAIQCQSTILPSGGSAGTVAASSYAQ